MHAPLFGGGALMRFEYRTSVTRKMRNRAADRQGWRCWWCGFPMVDQPSGVGTDQMGVSADHWPVKKADGGKLTEGNVVAAHARCNSTRADDARPHAMFISDAPPPEHRKSRKELSREHLRERLGPNCAHCGIETTTDATRDWLGHHPPTMAVKRARVSKRDPELRKAAADAGTLWEIACNACAHRLADVDNQAKVARDQQIQGAIRRWRDEVLAFAAAMPACEVAE